MNVRRFATDVRWIWNALVGGIIGVSLAVMISGDPVSLPAVGTASGVAVGAAGIAVGGALYTQLPGCGCGNGESECGCDGECGC